MTATVCPAVPTKTVLPLPVAINQLKVTWVVVVPEDQPGVVWIALTPKQYENLAKNYSEIIRWTKESAAQLEYYHE